MSGPVRAKMKVSELRTVDYGGGMTQKKIILTAQYDQKVAEDVSFCKATPTGHIEMVIDNPVALDRMPVGTYFYVDFTPIG